MEPADDFPAEMWVYSKREPMRRVLSWAATANEAVLPLMLWGVSQEAGLPGWLSALIKPDGFLTLNKWIDLCVASLTRAHICLLMNTKVVSTALWSVHLEEGYCESLQSSRYEYNERLCSVCICYVDKVLGRGFCRQNYTQLTPQVLTSSAKFTTLYYYH